MEWQDTGLVINARKHAEHDVVLEVFTPTRGLHRGYVKGGAGRRKRGDLQPGNLLKLTWRSRIEENLGSFTHELLHSPLGVILSDPKRLAALTAICSSISMALAEREAHPQLYDALKAYIAVLEHEDAALTDIIASLVRLELGLLREIGFRLDLSECAATGATDGLCYVSPKSARAVSKEAGEPYRDRMLPLPQFLTEGGNGASAQDCLDGLVLTAHFLDAHVWRIANKDMPEARQRLINYLNRP